MDESSISEVQRQQADALANAYQQDMHKESTSYQQDLADAYAIAHHALISLMPLLNQEEVEKYQKSGKSIYRMDDREAQQLITRWIKKLREKAAAGTITTEKISSLVMQLKALEKEKERLQNELSQQKIMNQDLRQTISAQKIHTSTLEQTVTKIKDKSKETDPLPHPNAPPQQPVIQGMVEPGWMKDWRKKITFEKDAEILRVIGETGFSRRPEIIQIAAKRLGKNSNNTALVDAINRLDGGEEEKGLKLVERVEGFEKQGFDLGGALPIILRLTEKGKQAYWMLTGANPQECEFDRLIKHHKTPEHTLLNLIVRDQLVHIGGYEVLLDAPALTLPNGEKFVPDIVAVDSNSDDLLFIEVERYTDKDAEYRVQKWQKIYAATHGKIYVYCDRSSFMKNLIGEINQALKDFHYSSCFSNYEDVKNGKRGSDGSIWIQKRV